MTRSHSATPHVAASTVTEAIDVLRASGLRVSAARRLVLEALYLTGEPLTVDQLASGLDGRLPASDPASVYRNLETLEEVGLVRHVHLGHAPARYAPASAGVREYLLCDACGAVRAVDPAELDAVRDVVRERHGFEASFTHFPIAGLCASCAAQHDAPA
jgi:Fur family ferric uptake transcriptional regulator